MYTFFIDTIQKINHQIKERSHGRLFAVIAIAGKQFKITPEDVIIIQGAWFPTIGDRIRFEKVNKHTYLAVLGNH